MPDPQLMGYLTAVLSACQLCDREEYTLFHIDKNIYVCPECLRSWGKIRQANTGLRQPW